MKTKITEIAGKTVHTEWCPIKQFPGLVALASKKVGMFDFFIGVGFVCRHTTACCANLETHLVIFWAALEFWI
jgi:hypothetical protein